MDPVDRAKQEEQLARDVAIQQAKNTIEAAKNNKQYIINGIVYCLYCHELIDKQRLKARPYSTHCIDCKTEIERREHHHGK